MVTPTPHSFGQLLKEGKPELHLIHHVIVVHIDVQQSWAAGQSNGFLSTGLSVRAGGGGFSPTTRVWWAGY